MIKAYFILLIALFLSPFLLVQLEGVEQTDSSVYFFVVDLSGSMRWHNLSQKVPSELKEFIGKEVKINDRLVLAGFGDNVVYYWDNIIQNTLDYQSIYRIIDTWRFNHNWTHMSSAFDHLAKRLDELNQTYPQTMKYVYFFTDGINDPPPNLAEESYRFEQILNQYFSDHQLRQKNAYIYYITLGIDPPDEIVKTANQSDQFEVHEIPIGPDPIIPNVVQLELLKDSYLIKKSKIEQIEVVFKVKSITQSTSLLFSFNNQQERVNLDKDSKEFSLKFTPVDLGEGLHNLAIKASPSDERGNVIPDIFNITYEVIDDNEIQLELKKAYFQLIQGRREKIQAQFNIKFIAGVADLIVSAENEEIDLTLNERDKGFNFTFSPQDIAEGEHSTKIIIRSKNSDLRIIPSVFDITYQVKIPDYTMLYILGGLLLIVLICFIIYLLLPSFRGKLIFTKDGRQFIVPLKGKLPKSISKMQSGWGLPSSLKVCPTSTASRLRIKHKLSSQQQSLLLKDGLEMKQKSFIIRTGERLEYDSIEIQFESR